MKPAASDEGPLQLQGNNVSNNGAPVIDHIASDRYRNGSGIECPTAKTSRDANRNAPIKNEDGILLDVIPPANDDDHTMATATSLGPAPLPSAKRRESAAAGEDMDRTTSDPERCESRPHKRKREGASPPWTFPSAENSFVKTADGRRVSTRVAATTATNTPIMSEGEEKERRARSHSHMTALSRPPSPPWKKFEAHGPTSIQVDGVRKSGRVYKEPTAEPEVKPSSKPQRVSPRQKKQPQRSGSTTKSDARPPSSRSDMEEVKVARISTNARAGSPGSKIRELQAKIAALKPSRSFDATSPVATPAAAKPLKRSHKRKRSDEMDTSRTAPSPSSPISKRKAHGPSEPSSPVDITRPRPRIRLRLNPARRTVPHPHPHAHGPSPARPPQLSLYQIIEKYELTEAQQPYTETERGPPGMDFFTMRNQRQADEEAEMRRRLVREAQEPDGLLSKARCSLYQDDQQPEPPPQYGHNDHLAMHALYFRTLQTRERAQHRAMAKRVAQEALEHWKEKRGPTEEDVLAEQDRIFRLVYKQVVADVRTKWEMVAMHVQRLRREEWERQQEELRQERLRRKLEWSEAMVAKQRRGGEMSDDDLHETFDGEESSVTSEERSANSEAGENMSESYSSAESEDDEAVEMGEDDLVAYLTAREQEMESPEELETAKRSMDRDDDLSQLLRISDDEADGSATGKPKEIRRDVGDNADDNARDTRNGSRSAPGSDVEYDRMEVDRPVPQPSTRTRATNIVEHLPADDSWSSEESVDMDSEEDYDSDDDMSSDDDVPAQDDAGEDAASSNEDSAGSKAANKSSALLGFFNKDARIRLGLPTPTTSAEGESDAHDRIAGESLEDVLPDAPENRAEDDVSTSREPTAIAELQSTALTTHAGDSAAHDAVAPASAHDSPDSSGSASDVKNLIPQPSLLRGTLRSYQHAGLDWLASLYRNGTNGILADEMGLGKTIQTIALLAHLAEEWQIWETHLVIVPTSVILNWVTEFNKFLPGFRVLGYYGSAEERQIKRKGWVNDPHAEQRDKRGYNVVVTSYNIAMQDINAMRNVQWHYLVLDEAHNIRNFNSQKWQVLIRLKTRARLMLTGTPLQNSLTELWALLTFLTAGDDDPKHGGLEEFLSNWKEPVKEIFERGVAALSEDSQRVVHKLHVSLRPFLLRRLKADVEKDLPKKRESVVVCKLSKRQRQLYEEYMGLASTRHALTRGNGISAGRVLMALRRVCNHPDLFDPRSIQTSFAMESSVAEEALGKKESLVRRLLLGDDDSVPTGLIVVAFEGKKRYAIKRARKLAATDLLRRQVVELESAAAADETPNLSSCAASVVFQNLRRKDKQRQQLRDSIRVTDTSLRNDPVYGADLRELLTIQHHSAYLFTQRGRTAQKYLRGWPGIGRRPLALEHPSDWYIAQSTTLQGDVLDLDRYAQRLHDTIVRFTFCPPVVTAPILDLVVPPRKQAILRGSAAYLRDEPDFAHEARLRTAINFPDKRLLIYDAGKLQRLTLLLRELQSRGSRSLIFTQSTATLDILETFLNLLNLPYLRLDGSTHVERRQLYAAEFNRPDSRYQCMILSSRAGGVGLNLIGASSVIFYDLDWNPQMDRQCMDRAHRIGQVRDVEVYKMVSEKTIEENILRRANQKSLLDQTVIQEGNFTTDYQRQPQSSRQDGDGGDDVSAALDRFLGGGEKAVTHALESVEDREDVQAAERARKEELQQEDADERSIKGGAGSTGATPGPSGATDEGDGEAKEANGHLDGYLVRLMREMWADVAFVPPPAPSGRKLDRHGRDPSHRPRRKR